MTMNGRYIDLEHKFRRLEDELFCAQETVLNLMSADMQKLLNSYYSVNSRAESYLWRQSVIDQLIELAEPLLARSTVSEPRACCPLCGFGSMSYYDDGFALPLGLRRHLEGAGRSIVQCGVMKVASKMARDHFNGKFSAQEELVRLEKKEVLEIRRKTEQLYLIRLGSTPQLVDEVAFGGRARNSEELEWAGVRLKTLGFSMLDEDGTRRYELDLEKLYVLADPREKGRITFVPYKKPFAKQRKPQPFEFSGINSFYLLDSWKHDLAGKLQKRLENL